MDRPESPDQDALPEIDNPDDVHCLWHDRRYLPHCEGEHQIQHVTLHLVDSLPEEALKKLQAELERIPPDKQDIERRRRVDALIDAGHGSCALRIPELASVVQNAFLHFNTQRYDLVSWVVMPNHAHVLFQPIQPWTMGHAIASWKKFSGRVICAYCRSHERVASLASLLQYVNRKGDGPRVWQREYWDRYMRDGEHLRCTIEYIHENPVKAGLVSSPESSRWSSAHPDNAGLTKSVEDIEREFAALGIQF